MFIKRGNNLTQIYSVYPAGINNIYVKSFYVLILDFGGIQDIKTSHALDRYNWATLKVSTTQDISNVRVWKIKWKYV